MTKEKIEEIKHILFHEYSWASTEIDKLDLHINDVIEATEQAINVIQCCKSDSELLKCSGCKKPLHDGLCGSCCSDLASGMY